jgi:hypothetical protein
MIPIPSSKYELLSISPIHPGVILASLLYHSGIESSELPAGAFNGEERTPKRGLNHRRGVRR